MQIRMVGTYKLMSSGLYSFRHLLILKIYSWLHLTASICSEGWSLCFVQVFLEFVLIFTQFLRQQPENHSWVHPGSAPGKIGEKIEKKKSLQEINYEVRSGIWWQRSLMIFRLGYCNRDRDKKLLWAFFIVVFPWNKSKEIFLSWRFLADNPSHTDLWPDFKDISVQTENPSASWLQRKININYMLSTKCTLGNKLPSVTTWVIFPYIHYPQVLLLYIFPLAPFYEVPCSRWGF